MWRCKDILRFMILRMSSYSVNLRFPWILRIWGHSVNLSTKNIIYDEVWIWEYEEIKKNLLCTLWNYSIVRFCNTFTMNIYYMNFENLCKVLKKQWHMYKYLLTNFEMNQIKTMAVVQIISNQFSQKIEEKNNENWDRYKIISYQFSLQILNWCCQIQTQSKCFKAWISFHLECN